MAGSALLLAPEAPYPLAGGGALRTASILEYLARRYATDLIVFREPGAPDPGRHLPPGLAREVTVIELPAHGRGRTARAWRNAWRLARRTPPLVDRFAGFGDAVARAVAGRSYEIGIVEHFWCAPYLTQLAPACRRTVLDLHNIESVLHGRCADVESAAAGFAHRMFAGAALELERTWLPRFSEVLAASEEDARTARAIAPKARVTVYPNAIPARPLPPRADEPAVVFSGNMEYHPNRSAVRWFAREVWPVLRRHRPELVWRLVGKNPEAVREFISPEARIEATGPVEDAVAELARARVAVAPLLAGSGTRLKILEAWAAGVPVVSTTLGAEGLGARPGEHLLVADGAVAFAAAVERLLDCNDMRHSLATSARLLLEKEFTWDAAWRRLHF
ncbi:MAG TPA: glycosyltransferase [Bryobacteraceae bacterium]|nr:glycosyltransferase [Bryobacteraceae bacterium]